MSDLARERDFYGRVTRDAWVAHARTRPDCKPSWLVPYEDLDEADKEADRRIGDALRAVLAVDPILALNGELLGRVERQAAELERLKAENAELKSHD
jgi:hypothetical protein